MTPAGELLRDQIRRDGPISFSQFMEVALYHSEHGYYRRKRDRDPFGKRGDFFTAEQLQPVFGILIARRIEALFCAMGEPEDFQVVEIGAGREEMAEALGRFRYFPVEAGEQLPERITGVVFSNEFFDALPVHRVVWRDERLVESLVGFSDDRFVWVDEGRPSDEISDYVQRYLSRHFPHRGHSLEVNLEAVRWMERIGRSVDRGWVFTIDYGYTTAESVRFPEGTLMSYRRHQALEDVLADPGERDITAHVCFAALEGRGLETERFESLARTLLDAGEADQFASVLEGPDADRRKLQLKTLLFGMGETYRVLLQRKVGTK